MPLRAILIVAWLEWFVTLAVQMLVLRLVVPVVGSSLIVTSVFIWVILLALSFGYLIWAKKAAILDRIGLKNQTLYVLTFALVWYAFWTFPFIAYMLERLLQQTWSYYFALWIVAIVLIFPPVFIAAQLLPLLAELTPYVKRWEAAWKLLFVSTIGSFLGSIGTSILLIQYIWVQGTRIIVVWILLLATTIVALASKKYVYIWITCFLYIILVLWWTVIDNKTDGYYYEKDTVYQNIALANYTDENWRWMKVFHANKARASWIYNDHQESPFKYIETFVDITDQIEPERILVIWGAGFVYPYLIQDNVYTTKIDVVDIDPRVHKIAEEKFLSEKLSSHIVFRPRSARFYLREAVRLGKKYDLVVLDAYNGKIIPDELVTTEFFKDIQAILTKKWSVVANVIGNMTAQDKFTQSIFATMVTVWPDIIAIPMKNKSTWLENIVVTNQTSISMQNQKPIAKILQESLSLNNQILLYTDNRRTTEMDLITTRYQ
jgi:spermidine synthase